MSDERRQTDPLLVEVHGMLKGHLAHFEEHVLKDEERHVALTKRLAPVEELNTFIRVLMKVGATILAIGGMGGVLAAGRALMAAQHNQ